MRRAILSSGLTLIFAAACTPPAPRTTPPPHDGRARLEQITVDRFVTDQLRVRARIAGATVDRERGLIEGEQITIAAEATIEAPRGRADLKTKIVDLEGGVTIVDRDRRKLTTESLRYDAPNDTLITREAVTLEGENFRAHGGRTIAKPNARTIDVEGPATATVRR